MRTDAPKTLRTTIYHQPSKNRILVHFINRSVNQRVTSGYLFGKTQTTAAAVDFVPIRDIHVSVRLDEGTVKDVTLGSNKEALRHKTTKGWVHFTIPKIDIHDIAVVQLA